MTLNEVIALFMQEIPCFENARDAWGMCDVTSSRFIRFAEGHGITGLKTYTFYAADIDRVGADSGPRDQVNPAPEWYPTGCNRQKNEGDVFMCGWHCIVDAGECLIDFTSRQYQTSEHRMPFPLVIPMNKAMGAHA